MVEEYSRIIKPYLISELYELIEDKTSYISYIPKEILRIIIKYCGENNAELTKINTMNNLISFVKNSSIYTDYFYMEILSDIKIKCIVKLNDVNYYTECIGFNLLNPRKYDIAPPYLTKLKIYNNVDYINFIQEQYKFIIEYNCRDNNNNKIKYHDITDTDTAKIHNIYIKPLCFPVATYNNNQILDIIRRIDIKND